jgi:signal transduction histidine kinase
MNIKTPRSDVVRMIRLAAFLLLGYVVALFFINLLYQSPQSLLPPQMPEQATLNQTATLLFPKQTSNQTFTQWTAPIPGQPVLPQQSPSKQNNYFYVLYGAIAVICLVLAYWPWLQRKLKWAFIPVVVAILSISPVFINQLGGALYPLGPRFGSTEATFLTMFPFLFVALLLVAWQYKWQFILIVILGITALNLGVRWTSAGPGTQPFQGVLALFLIQTVIFLVVGFSISYLMSRIRVQQQSLEAANSRLTQYASTLEQLSTSRERNRLALELHDTLAHTLSGLSVQLETVKAYWDVDRPAARSILEKSLAATHSGLEETRRALKALRASPLDDLGLILALRNMAENAASRAGVVLNMPETINLPPLTPDVEHCIYRIAQEAINNIVKHASAKNITIKLGFADGTATLIISDDGTGFDINSIDNTSHFGLAGVRERAQMAGGEVDIISKPGEGTTIKLTIKQVARG